jgi:hypothetical protein
MVFTIPKSKSQENSWDLLFNDYVSLNFKDTIKPNIILKQPHITNKVYIIPFIINPLLC